MDDLVAKMHDASQQKNYEDAAQLRDTIKSIACIQARQSMISQVNDADVFLREMGPHGDCFAVAMIRGGHMLGHKVHFPEAGLVFAPGSRVNPASIT